MSFLSTLFDFIFHIDKHLAEIVASYGPFAYLLLFLIIFAETGFVLTPFLPGDSLLFAAGSLAANSSLNIVVLIISLTIAAILGDSFNYFIGYHFGEKVFAKSKLYHGEYMQKTTHFYDKHGKKTIILARFIPVVRTFAPFVAGISKMKYSTFLFYNVVGGIVWISLFLLGGYFLGSLSFVQENYSLFIIGIIVTSLIPLVIEIIKHYRKKSYHESSS